MSSSPAASEANRSGAPAAVPRPTLGPVQAIAIVVGIVIGAGIFKAPSLVAMNSPSEAWMMAAWVLGGVISIIGALCYCELATAYPSAGGDYHFLHRAFGRQVSFLFAWCRFSVITTGSIALLAFVFGDYMTKVIPLGQYSAAIWAVASVLLLTWVNVRGIRQGAATQVLLTWLEVGGLILVFVAGVVAAVAGLGASSPEAVQAASAAAAATPAKAFSWGAFGFAMVFVLLTFGGWNEGAYISAELRDRERNMVKVMVGSLVLVTLLYLAANWAYVAALGMKGVAESKAVAADLLRVTFGKTGEVLISLMVAVAALTSINATMMVGARSNFAAGRDWQALGKLGEWVEDRGTPANALVAQGAFALILVGLGLATGGGFATMVEYTAPVFWLFFLLSGLSLFVLRWREPATPRPFKVPLFPVLPLIFCLSCAYMLQSSLGYVGSNTFLGFNAAWVGVGVLAVGVVLMGVVASLSRSR
ncbi:MAG: APC family permease [Burkholderiales bacterium]|jgi:APA family basic amino acid/polyamine antiporter